MHVMRGMANHSYDWDKEEPQPKDLVLVLPKLLWARPNIWRRKSPRSGMSKTDTTNIQRLEKQQWPTLYQRITECMYDPKSTCKISGGAGH